MHIVIKTLQNWDKMTTTIILTTIELFNIFFRGRLQSGKRWVVQQKCECDMQKI